MEMTKPEVDAVLDADLTQQAPLQLTQLELLMVGGGCGEVVLG